jgi:hypothetical protein
MCHIVTGFKFCLGLQQKAVDQIQWEDILKQNPDPVISGQDYMFLIVPS